MFVAQGSRVRRAWFDRIVRAALDGYESVTISVNREGGERAIFEPTPISEACRLGTRTAMVRVMRLHRLRWRLRADRLHVVVRRAAAGVEFTMLVAWEGWQRQSRIAAPLERASQAWVELVIGIYVRWLVWRTWESARIVVDGVRRWWSEKRPDIAAVIVSFFTLF